MSPPCLKKFGNGGERPQKKSGGLRVKSCDTISFVKLKIDSEAIRYVLDIGLIKHVAKLTLQYKI